MAGVLLAAGRGTRFGAADKLLAPHRGRPVVGHAAASLLAALPPGAPRIAVTRTGRVAAVLPGFRTVPGGADLAESLAAGLHAAEAAGADHALVVLGDMPDVPAAHLAALIEAAAGGGTAASGYPAGGGLRPGVPACLPRALFAAARAARGDRGARDLLAAAGATLIPLPAGAGHDIDRPGDLRL